MTPSADLDLAVRGIVFSAAGTAGQRCTTLRRLIVHRSIADHGVAAHQRDRGVEELRARARDALRAVGADAEAGEPGGYGLPAGTPVTGDVLFTVAETSPDDADTAIAEAAQAFTPWRTTPAPARGAVVARLGELLVEHKADLATLVTIEAGKITSEAARRGAGDDRHLPVRGRALASAVRAHDRVRTLRAPGSARGLRSGSAGCCWSSASELTPLTALACQALIERAADDVGAPRAVSRLIIGGREVGERLVDGGRCGFLDGGHAAAFS